MPHTPHLYRCPRRQRRDSPRKLARMPLTLGVLVLYQVLVVLLRLLLRLVLHVVYSIVLLQLQLLLRQRQKRVVE